MIQRLKRPANTILAGFSYLANSVSGIDKAYGMPLSLGVELTNICNLNCPECLSGSGKMTRPPGFMDIGLFKKIIGETGPYLYNLNLYFQGEPMLHPSFLSFLEEASDCHSVVSTNGHFLSLENSEKLLKSRLNKLIISLDGMDQKTYSAYRKNGDINEVMEGILNISRMKLKYNSNLMVEIQFLVNKSNEHHIPLINKFAKEAGASLKLKSMQLINNNNIGSWLPVNDSFRRYKLENGKYIPRNHLPDRCARLWFNPVVTWDGKVVPCCFDKDADYIMGDLNNNTFKEIWNSKEYCIFRKNIRTGRNMIGICRNCTSGLRGVRY